MKINEIVNDNFCRIEIIEHKAVVKTFHFMFTSENDKYRQTCKFIEEISENKSGDFYGKQKELIKAYGEIDERFKDLYKELYPHGGWRNGGRPKGSRTDKTTMLKVRITPDEEKYLLEKLQEYRQNKNNPQKPHKKPIRQQQYYDDLFMPTSPDSEKPIQIAKNRMKK